VDHRQHPGHIDADVTEIDLGFLAHRMALRDHHLRCGHLLHGADLAHIAANRRLSHRRLMFLHQPFPHPPGRVPLLARRRAVLN
jgi:hypothetical protein